MGGCEGESSGAPSSRKRKAPSSPSPRSQKTEVIDLTADTPPSKRKKRGNGAVPEVKEKRLRPWRSKPPISCEAILERARTQRMFVLDRQRSQHSDPDHPIETVSLAGTTGNVYTVIIDRRPSCNCPYAIGGYQCKHIIYVLSRVLRAPEHLRYQLALLSSELCEIFDGAPALPSMQADDTAKDGTRKPTEGECPICCVDFEAESTEEIVYCKTSCGNNIHKLCFDQWAATKRREGGVTCPFCRADWASDGRDKALKAAIKQGNVSEDGYVNVADELGITRRRDHSSYNSYFRRNHFGHGFNPWD